MKNILFVLIMTVFSLNAQQTWYFGNNEKIDFNSGGSVSYDYGDLPNSLITSEGCSVAYDEHGRTMLASDGRKLWAKNNGVWQLISTALLGNSSTTSSCIILPIQSNGCNVYMIIAIDAGEAMYCGDVGANCPESNTPSSYDGVTYSIIRKNNLGIWSINNNELNRTFPSLTGTNKYVTEKIAVTSDGDSFWIVFHGYDFYGNNPDHGSSFYAYYIQDTTIPNPVISKAGSYFSPDLSAPNVYVKYSGSAGYMKFEHTGNIIANTVLSDRKIELFEFNKQTGIIRNINNSIATYNINFSNNTPNIVSTAFGKPYGLEVIKEPNGGVYLFITFIFSITSYDNGKRYTPVVRFTLNNNTILNAFNQSTGAYMWHTFNYNMEINEFNAGSADGFYDGTRKNVGIGPNNLLYIVSNDAFNTISRVYSTDPFSFSSSTNFSLVSNNDAIYSNNIGLPTVVQRLNFCNIYSDIDSISEEVFDFEILPTPASEFIMLNSRRMIPDVLIIITDINGKTLFSKKIKDFLQLRIELNDIADNTFFVNLIDERSNKSVCKKFIKN